LMLNTTIAHSSLEHLVDNVSSTIADDYPRYSLSLKLHRPPRPTLFPYTTLFRSNIHHGEGMDGRIDLQRLADVMAYSGADIIGRSEEHTSELQSRENLVCRLLLEKKNKLVTTRTSLVGLAIASTHYET